MSNEAEQNEANGQADAAPNGAEASPPAGAGGKLTAEDKSAFAARMGRKPQSNKWVAGAVANRVAAPPRQDADATPPEGDGGQPPKGKSEKGDADPDQRAEAEGGKPPEASSGDDRQDKGSKTDGKGDEPRPPDAGDADQNQRDDDGKGDRKSSKETSNNAWVKKRIEPYQRKLAEEAARAEAEKARADALEGQLNQLKQQAPAAPQGQSGQQPPGDAKAQYKALQIDEHIGPDADTYEDEAKWYEDFQAWQRGEPLRHHPKLGELQQQAPPPQPPEGQSGQQPPGDEATARRMQEATWWRVVDAAVESSKADDAGDVYAKLADMLTKQTVMIDGETLYLMSQSERVVDIMREFVNAPEKALRIFTKPVQTGAKEAAITKMLERVDKAAKEASEEKPGEPEGEKQREAPPPETNDLEPIRAAGVPSSEPENLDELAKSDYREYKRARQEQMVRDQQSGVGNRAWRR